MVVVPGVVVPGVGVLDPPYPYTFSTRRRRGPVPGRGVGAESPWAIVVPGYLS